MTALNKIVLEISADVDEDGSEEDGVFMMQSNASWSEQVEIGYILGGAGSQVNAVFQNLTGGSELRKGVFVDIGGGSHIMEIQFTGWTGAVDEDGNNLQWGNTGNDSTLTVSDATGAEPLEQIAVLNRYLLKSLHGSFKPATLYAGEYADGTYGDNGIFDPMKVAIQSPRQTHQAGDYSTYDGSMTCVETIDLSGSLDGLSQLDY